LRQAVERPKSAAHPAAVHGSGLCRRYSNRFDELVDP